jgi:enoyl-CoA hydratase
LMNIYRHRSGAHMLDATLGRQLAATASPEHHAIASEFIEQQKRKQTRAQ